MKKISRRIIKYAKENFGEVLHTTLNPEGPGVVRIHFIPPVISDEEISSGVAIINGQDIIPVNVSWCILLSEFIKNVNTYHGKGISEEDIETILNNTVRGVRNVFPFLFKKIIKNDIVKIMNTFTDIAYGNIPEETVEYISIGQYAPFMKAPHRMDLLVSSMSKDGSWNCNQRCVHCYAAGQVHADEQELTTDEWKKIIDKCRKSLIPQLTFTGGEPTMRADLFELIDYAKWFVTRLNTNGINLTKEYCEKLAKASLDSCQITFYSDSEEIHNSLVGANQYNNTVSGIKNALDAHISVSINTPLCTLNKDYVKTLEFLHGLGVTYVTCSGLIMTGNACKDPSVNIRLSSDEITSVLKLAVNYCKENGMEISFTSPGFVNDKELEKLGINRPTCGACLSNMAITPSGNVVPCQSFLSDNPLGNMLVDDWDEIWNLKECIKHREFSALMTGECPLRSEVE